MTNVLLASGKSPMSRLPRLPHSSPTSRTPSQVTALFPPPHRPPKPHPLPQPHAVRLHERRPLSTKQKARKARIAQPMWGQTPRPRVRRTKMRTRTRMRRTRRTRTRRTRARGVKTRTRARGARTRARGARTRARFLVGCLRVRRSQPQNSSASTTRCFERSLR